MTTIAPYRSPASAGRDGFGHALRAEWTKFRTVRGWVIGALVAVLATAGLGILASSGGQSSCQSANSQGGSSSGSCQHGISFVLGPNGEPVSDGFYFVRQPLAGDGSITVRVDLADRAHAACARPGQQRRVRRPSPASRSGPRPG